MALIICPECKKQISDKAAACPNCGLPAAYFHAASATATTNADAIIEPVLPAKKEEIQLQGLGNILISFDKDYVSVFTPNHYVSSREKDHFKTVYGSYYKYLKD